MTLEDTRALAGHKLVCELLQKSLGLWIEWIDSYHWETIELIQRTLSNGGVSFMFPFNQDTVTKSGWNTWTKQDFILSNMKDFFGNANRSKSKREVREGDASRQPYYGIVPWGLLENRVPQRSSGLSSFSHSLPTSKYHEITISKWFNMPYFRKLAIFSGYHRLSPSEIRIEGTCDTFSEGPVIWIMALSLASLAARLPISYPDILWRMTKQWLNHVKSH